MSLTRSEAYEATTRWLGRALGVVVTLGIVLTVRVLAEGKAELAAAHRAESRGETDAAIVHYRRAARWYVPFGSSDVEALDALARIGEREAASGETERALSAHRAIRASLEAARSTFVPHRERLQRANARIAALMAELPAPAVDAGKSPDRVRREHLALLEADRSPQPGFVALAVVAFAVWVTASALLFSRGIDDEDRVRGAFARWCGTLVIIGFGVFVLALSLA